MKLAFGLVVLALPVTAAADDMFVSAGGTIGIGTTVDGRAASGLSYEPEGTLGARLTLSWEQPRLEYKEPRGYRWRAAFVPEVVFGVLYVNDRRTGDRQDNTDGFVAVGARADLAFSQRRGGLLQLSARGGFYLAARGGLLTDGEHTPMLELAGGEYLWLSERTRLGFEVGGQRIFGEQYTLVPNGRVPWRDGDGQYLSLHVGAYMSWRM